MAEKIVVSWEMDNKQAIKAMRSMRGEMEGVPKSTDKASKGVTKLQSSLRKLGTVISGVAILGGMRSVIRTFAEFETATVNVQNITGMATREMAALAREIKALPPSLGTATELMRGLYQAISAGVPRENAVAFLAENAKAAKGNLADLTITVSASTSVLAAYGLQTSETTAVLDAMTKTVDLGKLTFADMASNIGKGISIAAAAGVTYQELMATMAALTLSGLSVEEAMTGIRNILAITMKMDPGEGMRKFGVEMSTAAIKAQGFAGYMGTVAEAVEGNDEAIVAMFGNLRAMGAAMALASETGGERFRDILDQINDSTGKVEENFARMANTFNAKAAEMGAQMELLKIKIAEDVMPALVKAMSPVIDLLAKMVYLISFEWAHSIDGWVDKLEVWKVGELELARALKESYGTVHEGLTQLNTDRFRSLELYAIVLKWKYENNTLTAEEGALLLRMMKARNKAVKALKAEGKATEKTVAEIKKMPPAIANVIEAVEDWTAAGNTNSETLLKAGDNFHSFTQTYLTRGRAFGNITRTMADEMREVTTVMYGLGPAALESSGIMQSTFSDLLGRGFIGELETFADLWDAIWQDLAKSMTGILSEAFEDAFSEGGGGFGALFGTGEGSLAQRLRGNELGAIIGGAGMMYSGYQQGGGGGIAQGALGGMMTGASIGTMIAPGIGTAIGAAIGTVVGGVMGYLGGPSTPRAAGSVSLTGGRLDTINQNMSGQAESLWVQQRVQEYRGSIMQMNDILRLFGEGELFDLIARAPTFSFGGGANPLDELAAVFHDRWLPDAMRQMFRAAINRGLRSFDVDSDTRAQLWQEINALTGDARIQGLETFIGALVGVSNLYDDMNWNAIMDESRQDSLTSFLGGMGEALSAVQGQMLGLDQMTLLERAGQAQTIEQLMLSARNAEIQMLMQIDALQDSINQSIDAQIEGIRTGGMDDAQLRDYYGGMINSLMEQLRAGVDSPEAIQQIMADLQRYIGSYQSAIGDSLYTEGLFGGTTADYLVGILEEARGLSNEALEGMRDQIRESNDALIAELGRLIDALTHYGDTIATADQQPQPELVGNIGIDVNVFAEDGFGAWVDTRIDQWYWRQQNEAGPN